MASSRADIAKLPLPAGIRAGVMVGRGGHNVKWLHFNSGGAHITVNDTGIVIRAKDSNIRARAAQLVQRQLEAVLRLGVHDCPSPTRVDFVLLQCTFGTNPRVRFSQRNDNVANATGYKDKLFQLIPEPNVADLPASGLSLLSLTPASSLRSDSSFSDGSITSMSSAGSALLRDQDEMRDQDQECTSEAKCDANDTSARFHAVYGADKSPTTHQLLASAGRALEEAVTTATSRVPQFDVIKIRFQLGKNLFRNLGARADKTGMGVADLEGVGAGRGMYQSTFSNYIPAETVRAFTSFLTERLGFALVGSKTTANFHVLNQELNVHYSIALGMERGDDSTACLRKLKAGGSKSHSVTLLGGPEQVDLRLKLVTQFREHPGLVYDLDAHSTAKRVANAVRAEGYHGFVRSKRGLPRNRHLEYARRKTKSVYEGRFEADGGCSQRVRISVMQVQDDKGMHYEVSGCLPDLESKPCQPQLQPPVPAWRPSFARHSDGPAWRRPAGRSEGSCSEPRSCQPPSPPASVQAWRPSFTRHSDGPQWRRPAGHSDGGAGPEASYCASGPQVIRQEPGWAVRALGTLAAFVAELNAHVPGALAPPSLEGTA